ncbi:putative nuclease HARBI1 [Mercenaria mercenaria]|uniref:putative nuclease HARBI1 n=1 Tax=Mercenaria mercenaria TaxID=6596 RepID=UPI00234F0058|nr:putative nuclease HARBI1 [Mercenaria mercenaria]
MDYFCNILCSRFIVWPKEDEKNEIIRNFQSKKGFPGVIGTLDGSHIPITPPIDRQGEYINRKGFHSVVLQAVCRHEKRFTHIYCGWPGRVHDARVYRNSDIYSNLNELCGHNHILGDGAYPNSRCLLTAYRDTGHLTAPQKLYNKIHSSTRCIIENSFGLLKGRFRRLQHINIYNIEKVVKVIVSCCVLHNMCIMNTDELDDIYDDHVDDNPDCPLQYRIEDAEGTLKRILITRQLSS